MNFKWSSKRKYDATRIEKQFEKMVKENGYTITAYKECWSKTGYKIEKDGIEIEYSVLSEKKNAKLVFSFLEDTYNLKKKCIELQKAEGKKNGK